MRTDLGAAATLAPPDLETTDFVPGCLVHIEGYLLFNPGLVGRIIEMAKASRCTISLDLSSFEVVRFARNELAEHLRQTDIVFANESEAAEYCDGAAPSDALEQLSRICPVAVVKIGKAGALVRRAGEPEIAIPTRAVQAVDTTGAGDLWQAGFLHGYLRNLPLEACGRIGNLLGGEVVQVLGAAIPEERWTEIRRAVATLVSR
jgi:sugar/nucleoside kinase (ribokinase family)